MSRSLRTTVGVVDRDVLAFTAGRDVELDCALIEVDCLGTAAHVTMLSRMPVRPRLFSDGERRRVVKILAEIVALAQRGKFEISMEDQDVHLAVERHLTARLGELGKKVHTGRSRNDQVATDLRLFAKQQLLATVSEAAGLVDALTGFAQRHAADPMVGRTHMQPAMPSSVGLWASAFAESLLDDIALLINAYDLNDQCPLGSAASYGVPLPLDRQLVSDLLGFGRPVHNVLYANNARGKMESIILHAMTQAMLSLSRLAQDLILFSMPEFGYFTLPDEFCTGSSIMPQKKNPDVLELMRAKAAMVMAYTNAVQEMVKASPSGYNRDLQEAKGPFMEGIAVTRASLRIMSRWLPRVKVNRDALLKGFTPDVFATDHALELVAQGTPFRDAYHQVKKGLQELAGKNPYQAIAKKTHLGATAGIDFELLERRCESARSFVDEEQKALDACVKNLLRR